MVKICENCEYAYGHIIWNINYNYCPYCGKELSHFTEQEFKDMAKKGEFEKRKINNGERTRNG